MKGKSAFKILKGLKQLNVILVTIFPYCILKILRERFWFYEELIRHSAVADSIYYDFLLNHQPQIFE